MLVFLGQKGEPLRMGRAMQQIGYWINNIEQLARYQERLFHRANGRTFRDLVSELEHEGFKPFAFSTGEETVDNIVEQFEVIDENIRVLDYAKLSKKFNPGKVFIVYKHYETKMRPSSLHGAPMSVVHCRDYAV